MTSFEKLRAKFIAAHNARIDRMTAEELLEFISQPLMPWEERNVNGPLMTAIRRATARLDVLTK
jgi:hypothetical protein